MAAPPRPLRIVRLTAPYCGGSSPRPVRLPDRGIALIPQPSLAAYGLSGRSDNTFAIGEDGVVVGTFATPLVACDPTSATSSTMAKAFVWLPRDAGSIGLPAVIPTRSVVDLGGLLPPATLSVANDVDPASHLVVGAAGSDLDLHPHAWLWDLATATVVGGTVTFTAWDLHGSFPGAGSASVANAVHSWPGAGPPLVVGRVDSSCQHFVNLGFVLAWPPLSLASHLVANPLTGDEAVAMDLGPTAPSFGSLTVIGRVFGVESPTGEPAACGGPSNVVCPHPDFAAAAWMQSWAEDGSWGTPAYPTDFVDRGGPTIETTIPSGFEVPGSVAMAINADGEYVGMGWRYDPGAADPMTDCRWRAAFWWWEGPGSTCSGGCWRSFDLDTAYSTGHPLTKSRADALSRRNGTRDWLIVAGEDLATTPEKAVCWCGYADSWERAFLEDLARFDDKLEAPTWSFWGAVPADWRISLVHDMNSHGQMVVTLSRVTPVNDSFIEYPCIVTSALDFDGDFRVDGADFSKLLGDWGASGSPCDVDESGTVGSGDLAERLGAWTGTDVVDLHAVFPCTAHEATSASQAAAAAEGDPLSSSLDTALAALGFASADEFVAWCGQSPPEPVANVLQALRSILEAGQ